MDNKEHIYVVLIKALTGLGKFTRKLFKYEYTHIAVSLDDKLNDFVTFSRKKHHSPFDAGLMHEKIEHYAFGDNKKVKVKVYKIPVTSEYKNKIIEYIENIENDNEYIFNLYSMVTMPIFHGIKVYKAHNCMSFATKIIELTNSVKLKKAYYKYNIKEIDDLLNEHFDKECYLEKLQEDNEYMVKENFIKKCKLFFKLNFQLCYRILVKRNKLKEEE